MNITLRQLHAFVAVALVGSFSRAAERLHMGQSAVSVLVRELETELGLRLFDRTTRRVELTDAGREFRVDAERLIAELDRSVRHTRDLVERRRGRITVATTPLLASALLSRVIVEFRDAFPGVQVALNDLRTDQVVARVKSGDVDLGVGTFAPDEDGVYSSHLLRDRLMLFCAADHPLARNTKPRWKDLKGLPLVSLTRDSGIRALVDRGYEDAGLVARPDYELSQISTVLAMVEVGLGISVLPTHALHSSRYRRVSARTLGMPEVSRDIVLISRRGRSLPPAADDFIAVLRRYAAAEEAGALVDPASSSPRKTKR
jgi:DNA-binding transcriptional LysR family regulator